MPAYGSPSEPYGSAEWCHAKSAGSREGDEWSEDLH